MSRKYIDVSAHQGVIDFNKVKGQVDGVIIRAGYGRGNIDKYFNRNASECNRLGIPCGAYWFSYAYTPAMAKAEAQYLLNAVNKFKMELPLAFDWEYDSFNYSKKQGVTATATLVKQMTNAFCQEIENNKYWCLLYTNGDYINKFFGNLAGGRYDLWYAAWPKTVDVTKPPRQCGIWQWGGSAVPGISGNVDSNEAYKDYPTFLRGLGMNHLDPIPEPTPDPEPEVPDEPIPEPAPVEPEKPAEPETPPAWYEDAMKWAKENGINDGTRPTEAATRAEVSQMLKNFHDVFCH